MNRAPQVKVPAPTLLPSEVHSDVQLSNPWTLVAYNKRVLQAWEQLSRDTPANALPCYEWLSQHATRIKPRRCYQLKGERDAGVWAYEIGSGDRVYYKPIEAEKKAIIYYVGRHPSAIPIPPPDL